MMKIGLDKTEVRSIFRSNFIGRFEEEPSFIDCIADAVSEVVEENNKKLWADVQEAVKKSS